MKKLVPFALAFALFATPLFASKKATVTIPENVTVGSTPIQAGEYKLTYEGSGPDVKVTLSQSGHSPVVLDAKLVPSHTGTESVTMRGTSGERTLVNIDLGKTSIVFQVPQSGEQPQDPAQ
jgi:hypothetical protein